MARLSESDYRKTLEVVYATGEVDGPIAFPEPVLEAVRELVPCDVVTFHQRSDGPDRVLVYTGDPQGQVTPEIRAAHRQLEHEDPVQPTNGARKLTDVVRLRAFRRQDFYVEVHRPLGIEYMIWLYLDPPLTDARLELDRADFDFTERDRGVLDLLLPHLRQRLRIAARRPTTQPSRGDLTPREQEVIALVAEGRTNSEVGRLLGISPETVRKHLENTYRKLDAHTRTGAVAAAFGQARGE